MFPRMVAEKAREALLDTPAILLVGARQAGKSTLVRSLLTSAPGGEARYVTLDDPSVLSAATHDPTGWLAAFDGPIAIDEVQKAPQLLSAIKAAIDRDRRPGRFLLTGSANVLTLPRVSESLAGRVEVIELHPLSQVELAHGATPSRFVASLFDDRLAVTASGDGPSWRERALAGGFPEAVARSRAPRRSAWFESYLTTILARDVRDVADLAGVASLPRLLRLCASRAAGLLNVADLARSLDLPQSTVRRYLDVLEAVFLIRPLSPWHANLGKRLVKAPKLFLTDTGLLAHFLGLTDARAPTPHDGALLESLAVVELVRQASVLERPCRVFHFRTHAGHEVDAVLEDPSGRVVGIEIKATATPTAQDFRGLALLESAIGDRFVRGIVLCGVREALPFGAKLAAVPMGALFAAP